MRQDRIENITLYEKTQAASWRVVEFFEFSDYVDMAVVMEGRNLQRQIFAFIQFNLMNIVDSVKKVPALKSGNQFFLAICFISHFCLLFS